MHRSVSRAVQRHARTTVLSRRHEHTLSQFPQSKPFLDLQATGHGDPTDAHADITTLDNGVKVISKQVPGAWSNVTTLVNVGARNETAATKGAMYLIDRLAFKSNLQHRHSQVVSELESIGGDFMCQSNRESILYSGNVVQRDVNTALRIMSQSLLIPDYTSPEFEQQKEILHYDIEARVDQPGQAAFELIHQAAYPGQSMGVSLLPTPAEVAKLTPDTVEDFRRQHVRPDEIVVAGVGVDHGQFVQQVETWFGSQALPPSQTPAPSIAKQIFTGGLFQEQAEQELLHPSMQIPLAHLCIGFESPAWTDMNGLLPYAVIQCMLGGGSAFSSGGPGKGMHSRCYRYMLNLYGWIETALAINQPYSNTGLFAIQLACDPARVSQALPVALKQLHEIFRNVSEEEMTRSKNQLKSLLLLNVESKAILGEDMARQLAGGGRYVTSADICTMIDAVTMDQVRQTARRMLQGNVALSIYSHDLTNVPTHEGLVQFIDFQFKFDNI